MVTVQWAQVVKLREVGGVRQVDLIDVPRLRDRKVEEDTVEVGMLKA